MVTNKMQVEVWSDIMCPFCYIGKRQYEAALSKFSQAERVEIVWKSFQLDPSIPDEVPAGLTTVQYLSSKKGMSEAQIAGMNQQVMQMAKNVGLEYCLDTAVVYNSFKAHRILQMAKTKALGDALEERLFRSHFIENQDLGRREVLRSIAKEVGLSDADVDESLDNDQYAILVKYDIEEAHQIGVTGVPFFVFNRRYAVSGAQSAGTFLQTLEKSYAEWEKENASIKLTITDGQSCTSDGRCE